MAAEHGGGRRRRRRDSGPAGARLVGTCYSGQEINTPDDITSRSDGVLYFTDPTFASGSQGFPTLTLPLSGAQGVYRLTTDGVLAPGDEHDDRAERRQPSPDEKTLYVSYTLTGEVAKFDVAADGSLSNKARLRPEPTDCRQHVRRRWGQRVRRHVSAGWPSTIPRASIGTISVGGLIVTNCAFGGTDQKTLFITARTTGHSVGRAARWAEARSTRSTACPSPGIPGQN